MNHEIRDFYIDILMNGISGGPFIIQNPSLLIEHGILISDIEYLKIKRKQKLEEVESRNFIECDDDINDEDDFFGLDDL